MRLSKNFTLHEMCYSGTALRLGLDNKPTKEGIYKLTLLATLLQSIRNHIGALRITSGYRSPELNKAIGGSFSIDKEGNYIPKSQHCRYEAVDLQYFKGGQMDNLMIYQTLIDLDLDFDQCILEFGNGSKDIDPTSPSWIHLSWKISDNRKEVLVAYKDGNKTKYRKPIEYEIL